MTVGRREFSGKGAREQASQALVAVILSWNNDETRQIRARYRGFEILSQANGPSLSGTPSLPTLFVRGAALHEANLNAENPTGTVQSIDYTLRSFERSAERERERLQQFEAKHKTFQLELNKPFEHEARLQELLLKQTELNDSLDLNKSDAQAVAIAPEPEEQAAG